MSGEWPNPNKPATPHACRRAGKQLAVCLLCLGLSACQTDNPYTSDSLPLPAAPVVVETLPGPYPAAPVDFSRYRNWSWRSIPAGTASLGPAQLQEMVSDALDQRGLRPTAEGTSSDVQISVVAQMDTRLRQTYDHYGPRYGGGHYGGNYGMWGSAPVVRTYQEEVATVRIDLYDSQTGQVVWSNRAEARSGTSRAATEDAMREAVQQALEDYPPR